MELSTIKDAFDRVVKKQKLSSSKIQEVIHQVGREMEQALANIQSVQDPATLVDQNLILRELKTKLCEIGRSDQLDVSQKELNESLSKFPKVLEKIFNPTISKAYRNVDFDPSIVNQIIACHFYREGLFNVADCLTSEAGEPEAISLKSRFLDMHQILEAVKDRNIEPALDWVSTNREQLKQIGSKIEFKLHQLQFIEILQKKGRTEALNYVRTYLSPFASLHMGEIQKLMGCLIWVGKIDKSPYSDLIAPFHWEKLADELTSQFCSFLGQSYESPLSVALKAGFEGLPTLLKLANVMAVKKQEWQEMKQLPVPIDLGKEFQFHSIFVCPVSRDQATEENPPMLLPCGHVLCKQSIVKLSKSSTRKFKCPYCPLESSVAQCRLLHF